MRVHVGGKARARAGSRALGAGQMRVVRRDKNAAQNGQSNPWAGPESLALLCSWRRPLRGWLACASRDHAAFLGLLACRKWWGKSRCENRRRPRRKTGWQTAGGCRPSAPPGRPADASVLGAQLRERPVQNGGQRKATDRQKEHQDEPDHRVNVLRRKTSHVSPSKNADVKRAVDGRRRRRPASQLAANHGPPDRGRRTIPGGE